MKRYIILFLILSLLTACISVEFKNPQPRNEKILTEFPKEFIGTYLSSENDTFVIANTYFKAASITIETTDNPKASEIINLSENVILKKMKTHFILNMKDKGNWGIVILNKSSKGLIIHTFNANDQEFLTTLKSITKTEEIRQEDKLKRIVLDPSDKEFKKIISTPSLFEKGELIKVQ
jgi:hypothetical protein